MNFVYPSNELVNRESQFLLILHLGVLWNYLPSRYKGLYFYYSQSKFHCIFPHSHTTEDIKQTIVNKDNKTK